MVLGYYEHPDTFSALLVPLLHSSLVDTHLALFYLQKVVGRIPSFEAEPERIDQNLVVVKEA